MVRYVIVMLLSAPLVWAQPVKQSVSTAPASERAMPSGVVTIDTSSKRSQPLDGSLFSAAASGWSIEMMVRRSQLTPQSVLFSLSNGDGQDWLKASVEGRQALRFALRTDFQAEPLTIGLPLDLISNAQPSRLLIRYRGYSFAVFCNGVLVDEEWPIGKIPTGQAPVLTTSPGLPKILAWNRPLTDEEITASNGGERQVSKNTLQLLGPEPSHIQYSRPRGYNTNAGDAMPFYHDDAFHLYFLLDRRHHKSKWGLGAHQWAHISSTDLVHWTTHPIALAVDHEWEGSICTGSVFFHGGKYYAFYATRMPDRNQRLAIAEGDDGIHFSKALPTPFEEPKPPFVRGPNRDPFVFEADGKFHMIVTAAVAKAAGGKEGALEHLVSSDLKSWTVEKEPFLTSGSELEPECSDLFYWGDWYYLLFSLGGTTHYRMAHNPLGPWITPASDILDAPEAKVMKAAPFKNGRMLTVGFVQFDKRYGGTLIFRELVRRSDGTLGTSTPPEMRFPERGNRALESIKLDSHAATSHAIALAGATHFRAQVSIADGTRLTLHLHSDDGSGATTDLVFDPATATVAYTDHSLQSEPARLEHVEGMSSALQVDLVLDGTLADLELGGQRSMIHRLPIANVSQLSFSIEGSKAEITAIKSSRINAPLQPATP